MQRGTRGWGFSGEGMMKYAKLNSGNSHTGAVINAKTSELCLRMRSFQLYELYLNLKNSGQSQVNEEKCMCVCLNSEVEGRCMYRKPGQPAQISMKIQLTGT